MASMLEVVPWARFHMRPIQEYLKANWIQGKELQSKKIYINHDFVQTLSWWAKRPNIFKGCALIPPEPDIILTTDASRAGWGGFIPGHATQGLWTQQDQSLHINVLELPFFWLSRLSRTGYRAR